MGRCIVCGDMHSTCGQRSASSPVDIVTEGVTGMSVKRYEVDYDLGKGRSTKTTLKLNDAEAKRLGLLKEKPSTKKAAPANKSRSASNKKG